MARRRKLEYPFRRLKPPKDPTVKEMVSLNRDVTACGYYRPKKAFPRKWLKHAKTMVMKNEIPEDFRAPRWIEARIARRASMKVILDDIIKRLRRAPSERAFRLVLLALNEIGKRRGGGRLLRRTITQKLVNEFQARRR